MKPQYPSSCQPPSRLILRACRRGLLLLFLAAALVSWAQTYPAQCCTTAKLNVRSGPGTQYGRIATLAEGTTINVLGTTRANGQLWGEVQYHSQQGYVCMQYVQYVQSLEQQTVAVASAKKPAKSGFRRFMSRVGNVLSTILTILVVLLVIVFWRYILQVAFFFAFFAGGGALLFWILSWNAGVGAWVGMGVAAIVGVRYLVDTLDADLSGLLRVAYFVVSMPIYWLNQLEFFLVAPWRYIFRRPICSDSTNAVLRVVFDVLNVLLYVAITPLRVFNAAIYNIGIHGITSLYDLLFEVLMPCDPREGAGNAGRWIVMFPVRLLKYPVFHGFLSLVESVVWTAIDTVVPAVTLYHGTSLDASQSIVRDPSRNRHLRLSSDWTHGNFLSSSGHNVSWGGKGVYFAINRNVAYSYGLRASDRDMVMIVCRVSLGRVINYALTTRDLFNQTGPNGNHGRLNSFGERHHYTTGEWYNAGGGYWEYCMFDWQNGYNHPWRIRPIYVFNFRTGIAQHINGGMQHWLFDKNILKSLFH